MGQEESRPVDESIHPQKLKKRDIESVANYIKDGRAKGIVVMVCIESFYHAVDS